MVFVKSLVPMLQYKPLLSIFLHTELPQSGPARWNTHTVARDAANIRNIGILSLNIFYNITNFFRGWRWGRRPEASWVRAGSCTVGIYWCWEKQEGQYAIIPQDHAIRNGKSTSRFDIYIKRTPLGVVRIIGTRKLTANKEKNNDARTAKTFPRNRLTMCFC